jgi:hypothetical protein
MMLVFPRLSDHYYAEKIDLGVHVVNSRYLIARLIVLVSKMNFVIFSSLSLLHSLNLSVEFSIMISFDIYDYY